MKRQTIYHKIHNRLWVAVLLVSFVFSGCGRQEVDASKRAVSAVPAVPPSDTLTPETEAFFCQTLLFLQEGFRQHNIHKTYQVYFSAPREFYTDDEGNTEMHCDLLLADAESDSEDTGYWYESLFYTFDEASGWYTFTSMYEPVMAQDDSFVYKADSSYVKEVLENCIYITTLSLDTVVDAPVRYYAPGGPVVFDRFFTISPAFPRHHQIWLYTYRDARLDVSVTISYPVLLVSDSDLQESLNARILNAFFYGYNWDEEPNLLMPEKEIFSTIDRSYFVTREDEQYFSVRIYEYNEDRRAAHPNDWETGLTLSLETGEALTLRDIVGEKYTMESLINSGAFHCMWGDLIDYVDAERLMEADREWMEEIEEQHYQYWSLDDADFYLTDDSLGLIAPLLADDYICIEAKLSDLGLDEWIHQ